jgi:hypothetical protein
MKNNIEISYDTNKRNNLLNNLLQNIPEKILLNAIATEKNKAVYETAFYRLGRMNYELSTKRLRALYRLMYKYSFIQVFGMYGMNYTQLSDIWNMSDSIIRNISKGATKVNDMIGISKFSLGVLLNNGFKIDNYNIIKLNNLSKIFDINKFKIIIKIFNEEARIASLFNCCDTLIELYTEYKYNNIINLCTYLTREVKLQQGISSPSDASILLRDYIRMSIDLKHEYTKYPESLKKMHDITLMNYNTNKDKIKEQKLQNIVDKEEYLKLLYTYENYTIINPKSVKDVVAEGTNLSHCVASYVDDIISSKCKIYFMRYKTMPEDSLVTIEVRNGEIKQTKGKYNRPTTKVEQEFIARWATNKKLIYNI